GIRCPLGAAVDLESACIESARDCAGAQRVERTGCHRVVAKVPAASPRRHRLPRPLELTLFDLSIQRLELALPLRLERRLLKPRLARPIGFEIRFDLDDGFGQRIRGGWCGAAPPRRRYGRTSVRLGA